MTQKCCVEGCFGRAIQTQLKYYPFPRDLSLAQKWKESLHISSCTPSARVCSRHFVENDYMLSNLGWKILIPTAVPSLHLPDIKVFEVIPEGSGSKISVEALDTSASSELASSTHEKQNKIIPITRSSIAKPRRRNYLTTQHMDALKLKLIYNELKVHSNIEEMDTKAMSSRQGNKLSEKMQDRLKFKLKTTNAATGKSFTNVRASSLSGKCVNSSRTLESNELLDEELCCKFCAVTLPSKSLYQEHLLAHYMWSCHICPEAFRSKQNLQEHHLTFHSGKALICAYCSQRFGCYNSLSSHLNIHQGEKLVFCKICGVRFYDNRFQVSHFLNHMENQKQLRCDTCERNFLCVELFLAHNLLHCGTLDPFNTEIIDSENSEFFCFVCDMSCQSLQSWKIHFLYHSHHNEFLFISDKTFLNEHTVPTTEHTVERTLLEDQTSFEVKLGESPCIGNLNSSHQESSSLHECKSDSGDKKSCDGSSAIINNDEFCCMECGERCGSSSRLAFHYEKHVKEEPHENWSSDDESACDI